MPHQVLNWNGILSAEAPGLEFWTWSKAAAISANDLVEESLIRADADLRERAAIFSDAEAYAAAEYHLIEEPASFARAALFGQLAGSFEFTLLHLCNDAALATHAEAIEARTRSEVVLTRLRYLAQTTGTNFPSNSSEVLDLLRLRNVFVHADGIPVMASERDKATITRWLQRHPELADSEGHAIRLKAGFVRHCIGIYDGKLREISEAVAAKMLVRGPKPATTKLDTLKKYWAQVYRRLRKELCRILEP